MAAEYEVNIKLNTQEIKTQLNEIDRVVKDIGKGGRGGGSKSNIGAGIAKQLSLFTADSIFGRGRITGTALKNVKLSWLGAFDEIQDVANTIGGRRSARLLNVRTSWGKAFEGLSKNAKVLELGGLNTQTSWGKALTGLQDNAKVLKLGGINTQTSWGKALNGLQDNAKVLKLSGVNTQTSWTKALTGLQDNAKVLDIQNLNVRTSWGKALEQLGETAEIIAKNAAAARAQFLAGAPIPGLALGQTAGPARPPVQGAAFPIGGTAGIPGSPEFERALAIGRFRSSPIQGAANIPGSPEAKRARRERLEQVGLGAGFPLLFGGGAGSVIGGGLGGLTRSFGAQIAFSAIGQQIDQFVAGMVDAGKALTSVGGAADFMAEKSLFSSDSMQFRIEKLIEEGQVTEAAALMTKEMAKQVGGSGLKALKDLGDEANKMGKLFNALILQVQAFISRALTPLLAAINKVVGDVVLNNQFNALINEATGARAKEIEEFLKPFTRKARKGAAAKDVVTSEGKRLAVEKFGGQVIPEGAAIEPTGLELLRAGDKGSDKAAKDAERLARRLAGLEAERTKLEQLLQLDQQINAAKLEGDNRQIIALENEARLLEFAEKEAVIRASKVPQEQKIAELRNLGLERDRALLENAFKLDSFDKQKADDLKLQLDQLDLQLEAATAITREAENQAKLELLLLNLRESNKDLTEDQLEELMNKTRELFEAQNQGPLQSFITNSLKSLNDLEQHAVQVSQGIGNAIGNSLVNGMQNLITGAQSVKEVFADMLKSIADVLAKQAAQMIATYIAIGIARAFAGMGTSGGDPNSAAVGEVLQGGGFTTGNMADQAAAGKFSFASGGYVSGPTRALVGEGGEGEYLIPESKMRESMARYSRGARGNSVIPDAGDSGVMGEGGGTAVAAPIDVRYTVERINSVDYVTADQFQAGMQRAANQGAKQGEQQTLKRLQMSSSTRKRVGM